MVLKDKKTSITFHNGILTIGGTIIEIAYEDSHIFFDFGSEFNPSAKVQANDLQALLDEQLIPYLNNMFDPAIPLDGYTSTVDHFKECAVFLSHVHLDHSKAINYLNPSIPLYTLEGSKSLLQTLNINDDFLFPRFGKHTKNTRPIIGLQEYEEVIIGDIHVTILPVDHDAYGACGLLIKTPDLCIAYTGDIRLHGYRKEATLKFCKESYHCDVLLIEGVSVSFNEIGEDDKQDEICSEEALIKRINELVEANKDKQITFNYYISNIERILNIIKTNTRTVVLDAYYAYTVKEASGVEAYYYQLDDKDYGLNPALKIDIKDLLADTSRFFWQLDTLAFKYMNELKANGVYIHSNAQPLGAFDPSYAPFMERFQDHNINVEVVSCSGHAHTRDLIQVIDLIEPKLLTPIHSLHPERLYNKAGDMLLPEKKQTI